MTSRPLVIASFPFPVPNELFQPSPIASIGAAVTVGLRRGGLLVSVLVLPLYVPVLIFGLSASQPNAAPGLTAASLLILGAIALVSLVVSPLASAAALRSYLK